MRTYKLTKLKKLLAAAIAVITVIASFPVACVRTSAAYLQDSDNDGYLEILDADDLYLFYREVNGGYSSCNAELLADITVNESLLCEDGTLSEGDHRVWKPIPGYTGSFEGNGHTVSGLYFDDPSVRYVGLFAFLEGTVSNLTVADSYFCGNSSVGGIAGSCYGTVTGCNFFGSVSGDSYVGGICGYAASATINQCSNCATVSAGGNYAGGIVGGGSADISDCQNSGNISGAEYVAGIIGKNERYLNGCTNTGNVSGTTYVGGIAGSSEFSGITGSCNEGNVTGSIVGGIVGYAKANSQYGGTDVKSCYNSGTVSGSTAGGILGRSHELGYNNHISQCYNTGNISGSINAGGIAGRTSSVMSCYNTGEISGGYDVYVGGIIANGSAKNCYSIGKITITNYSRHGHICGNDDYSAENCYYLNENAQSSTSSVRGATSAEFAGGGITYLLGDSFGQKIGTDPFPVFGGAKVYRGYLHCGDTEYVYSNSPLRTDSSHTFVDCVCSSCGYTAHVYDSDNMGYCTKCGGYKPCEDRDGDGVYEITNEGQLYWFADQIAKGRTSINAILVYDITVTREGWLSPLNYSGTFDGNGHTVAGLIRTKSADNLGLFGSISASGTVKNVTVADSTFTGNRNVGGIAGRNNGVIENCYSSANIECISSLDSPMYFGGICGYNSGSIKNCHNTGEVGYASKYHGGIAGYNSGTVSDCTNTAETHYGYKYSGGIVGENTSQVINCENYALIDCGGYAGGIAGNNTGVIKSCRNNGIVYGPGTQVTGSNNEYFGGIAGYNSGTVTDCQNNKKLINMYSYGGGITGYNTGRIERCQNNGAVAVDYYCGGVCGYNEGTVRSCINDAETDGTHYIGGIAGSQSGGSITSCCNLRNVYGYLDYIGSIAGPGSGTVKNCYHYCFFDGFILSSVEGSYEWKSPEEYESGEVAFLLGEDFGQTLGCDKYPVLGGAKIYRAYSDCSKTDYVYSNEEIEQTYEHVYDGDVCTVCGYVFHIHVYTKNNGFCLVCDKYEEAQDSDGDGFYEITNAGQLYWFADVINESRESLNAILMNDITVNEGDIASIAVSEEASSLRPWTVIGYPNESFYEKFSFEGVLDGNGHTISGLYLDCNDSTQAGLFYNNAGTVKNLNIDNSYFSAESIVGSIAGKNSGTVFW